MENLKNGTRLIQNNDLKKTGSFELYNNQLNKKIIINSSGAKALKKYFTFGKIDKKNQDFFDQLHDLGFICESKGENVFLGDKSKYDYILSNLNLEITNICNLNCKHCYGSFGKIEKPKFINYIWIEQQISVFNKMHINSFSITGGEASCNKDFIKIVLLLLEHGFELSIFTNGFNYDIIKELLQKTKQYFYTIKVSLDGFEPQHNFIRRNKYSYECAIKTLDEIKKYNNVQLYISTAVMKENLKELSNFKSYISMNYPTAMHTCDLIFPSGEAQDDIYVEDDWEIFKSFAPELFKIPEAQKRKKRCSGGISQATLMPNGNMKICNAACEEKFYFKNNVFEVGLEKTWTDCGRNIDFFRTEKDKSTEDCKKCSYKKNCFITDCRVMADAYKHNFNRSNPLSCYIVKGAKKNETNV